MTPLQRHDIVIKGLPVSAARDVMAAYTIVGREEVLQTIGLSKRTLQRGKNPDLMLDSNATDRLIRLAAVTENAIDVFGSKDAAERWLVTSAIGLDGRKPPRPASNVRRHRIRQVVFDADRLRRVLVMLLPVGLTGGSGQLAAAHVSQLTSDRRLTSTASTSDISPRLGARQCCSRAFIQTCAAFEHGALQDRCKRSSNFSRGLTIWKPISRRCSMGRRWLRGASIIGARLFARIRR
ncbi:antitoxin Xre-like helix-turn-helix domain-containing protein [Paraburkholderia atlantica]|uniref:antitoxin Xre-like helix-turn-helix domain-containing protein n=1 Tax=Paraburkholderia atlantica TaxID=2654982 RepID=UPI0001BF1940|nr:antitoxin Xre-like helix-turn-helix domain-containing protein [Paraburkholderia atlantica]